MRGFRNIEGYYEAYDRTMTTKKYPKFVLVVARSVFEYLPGTSFREY
jgi:hypothetical protein